MEAIQKFFELLEYPSDIEVLRTYLNIDVENKSEYYVTELFTISKKIVKLEGSKYDILYDWMKMYDFSMYEDGLSIHFYLQKLKEEISYYTKMLDLDPVTIMDGILEHCVDRLVNVYLEILKEVPFVQLYFSDIVDVIKQDLSIDENMSECYNKCQDWILKIDELIYYQNRQSTYIKNAIIEPTNNNIAANPLKLLLNYELYLKANNQSSELSTALFHDYRELDYTSLLGKDEFFLLNNKLSPVQIIENDNCYNETFVFGMWYLVESELVLKKCNLCSRYFLNKYSYSANYCNVKYRDTKDTCQDYIAKEKYRKKTAENLISIEYSKVYTRIYSKVRRSLINKSEANFSELRSVRDHYIKLFEDAQSDKEKEIIVNNFKKHANAVVMSPSEKRTAQSKWVFNEEEKYLLNQIGNKINLEEVINNLNASIAEDSFLIELVGGLYEQLKTMDEEEWKEIQMYMPFFTAIE